MHNIKKKSLAVATAAVIGVTGVAGAGMASAANNTGSGESNNLVDKIASTFNLDKSKVKAVFDEDRKQHEADRQAKMEEKLSQAVKDGKLTETQKDAILAKLKELKAEMTASRETMKDKTHAERKATMKEHRADLEQWAENNDIPTDYLPFLRGGPDHHHGPMERPEDSAEQS